MTDKNINHTLEQLIDRLSIKQGKEKFVKQQVRIFFEKLADYNYINFDLFQYWNGGSFSRGIALKKRFDIDNYFIFRNKPWNGLFNIDSITGHKLFDMMYACLDSFEYDFSDELDILRDYTSWSHAIPIELYLGDRQSLMIDCIPAVEHDIEGYLIIPDGYESTKIVNRNLEQQALSQLNKMHNGKVSKLILLIKYWKIVNNQKIKSYIIERLAEEIFKDTTINNWPKGVKTFFNRAVHFLIADIPIPDRVHTQDSILHEYTDEQLDIFYKELIRGSIQASHNEWNKLFGDF